MENNVWSFLETTIVLTLRVGCKDLQTYQRNNWNPEAINHNQPSFAEIVATSQKMDSKVKQFKMAFEVGEFL